MKRYFHKGFTLIETIVVVAIFSLVMLAIASSIVFFYRTNASALEQAFAIQSAQKGIDVLVRDIREAIYSDEGSYPVVSIATSSFSFYSDIDRDDSVELTRYYIDGEDLIKGTINATSGIPVYDPANETFEIISDHVRNWEQDVSVFRYFDDTGTEILDFGDITDVAFVEVTLIVNINPSRLPNEFTLRSSATLRNLKTNL